MSENELRLVEPEDLYRFKFLLNTSLSPDGKIVAYTVTEADAEEMKDVYPGKGAGNTLDYWAGYAVNPDDAARLAVERFDASRKT